MFKCKVGYSGHENGVTVSLAASFLGISSLERHITLDRTMYGSDQAASLEFSGMKNLTSSLEKMAIALGENKIGHITEEEKLIAIRKVVEKYDKIALDEFEKQKNAELKIAKEQAKQIEDLFKNDTLNFQPKINIDYSKLGFSQQILDQLNKGFTIGEAVKNIENQTLSVGKSIFNNIINPLNQVFDVILSKGEKSWENFTKSVVEQLKKLYARLAAAAAIAGILSLATGGTAGGGVSFIKAFGSILGVNLGGGNIANPSFGGVQPGGMQMAGSVNMVLRGQDLVGSLNRTNSQFSRIG